MATPRQKAAVKKFVEKRGKSLSKAMREVGYSKNTAKNPQNLTKSKSWDELMEEFLPQSLVAKTHSDLLTAEETVFIPHKGKILAKKRPDYTARKNGADMAYKLRGQYAPDKMELSKRKFQDKSNEELLAIAQKKLKKGKD